MSILLSETNGVFKTRALEVHVTHTCNLHCDGCKHYSNYNHMGRLEVAAYRDWITSWSKHLQPKKIRLLGGEPTLHPELTKFLYITKEIWPETTIYITTNGYFLDRHPNLIKAMIDTNARMSLSVHSKDPAYLEKVNPIRDALKKYREETGVDLMETDVTEVWTRNYIGTGAEMKPYDDELPEESWEHCTAKYCMQLHENRLWKCAPIAYLGMQLEKFDLEYDPDWTAYMKYQSLGLEATQDEMREFLSREAEPVCGMCPAKPPFIKDKTTDWKDSFNAKRKRPARKAA
jgi:organic radical activating enzyme